MFEEEEEILDEGGDEDDDDVDDEVAAACTLSTDNGRNKSDARTSNKSTAAAAAAAVAHAALSAGGTTTTTTKAAGHDHHQDQKPPPSSSSSSSSSPLFRFVRGQDINSTFFSSSSRSYNNNNTNKDDDSKPKLKPFLVTGLLVWVCKSKGLKQKNKKRRKRERCENNNQGGGEKQQQQQQQQQQRLEAFLRARIVHGDDEENTSQINEKECKYDQVIISGLSSSNRHDEDRLLVRYPKGSTYMVKRSHLWPVLEPEKTIIRNTIKLTKNGNNEEAATLVLVFAETDFYRRACMVHTLPDGADIFWEIGCDAGSTIHKVAATLNTSSSSSSNSSNSSSSNSSSIDNESTSLIRVLGMDKSQESIGEARRLHPHLPFCLWDILAAEKKDNGKDTKVDSSSSNDDDVDDGGGCGDIATVPFASSLEQAIQDALAATSIAKATGKTAPSSSTSASNDETGTMQQQQTPIASPTVVAIDINGNRELPAVLACLTKVSSLWKPRLILIKSRALHGQLSLPKVEDATLAAMMMMKAS
jgi:hypothetical protein